MPRKKKRTPTKTIAQNGLQIAELEKGRLYSVRRRRPRTRSVKLEATSVRDAVFKFEKWLKTEEARTTSGSIKLFDYIDIYNAERKKTLDARTIERNELEIERIKRNFTDKPIDAIRRGDIERAYTKMRVDESATDKTIAKCHKYVKQLFRRAYEDGDIETNPAAQVRIPDPPVSRVDEATRAITPEQWDGVVADLDAAPKSGYRACVWLSTFCGLRLGEALALAWEDVDLGTEPSITVKEQYGKERVLKPAKTWESERVVPIDDASAAWLETWKKEQKAQLARLNVRQDGKTPIVTNAKGQRPAQTNFNRWRRNYFASLGLGELDEHGHYTGSRLHDLRHAYISRLIEAGVDVVTVQELAGHASATTTLNVYAKSNEAAKRAAVGKLRS